MTSDLKKTTQLSLDFEAILEVGIGSEKLINVKFFASQRLIETSNNRVLIMGKQKRENVITKRKLSIHPSLKHKHLSRIYSVYSKLATRMKGTKAIIGPIVINRKQIKMSTDLGKIFQHLRGSPSFFAETNSLNISHRTPSNIL